MRAEAISHCRLCAEAGLSSMLDLGELASCGVFPAAHEPDPARAPLELVRCDNCGLVQLRHDFAGEDLFRHTYGYRSGLNESMVRHLGGIAKAVLSAARPQAGDVILDIGSNDGTLLSHYPAGDFVRIGIDPTIARFSGYYPKDILTCGDFFSEAAFRGLAGDAKAKIITSIAMFYDLPDPNAFVKNIASVLAGDGVWVLEQSYLPSMLDRNSFDTICHEHLEYYCFDQIERLLGNHGLRAFDVHLNDVNGGSFQVWACHAGAHYAANEDSMSAIRQRERDEGFSSAALLLQLPGRVEAIRDEVLAFLRNARAQGKLVHGYGASTKGNTTLQHFGIDADLLPAIADRNVEKFGCRTPGTNIPIISEQESQAAKPDYYFVLPWHFRHGFIEREKAFLDRGGKLVFPLPKLEIISG